MKNTKFLTVNQLKDAYMKAYPEGHYFDEGTLRFFGEKLSDMKVLGETMTIIDSIGEAHDCYVLEKISHDFMDRKMRTRGYFDVETLKTITPDADNMTIIEYLDDKKE